MPEGAVSTDPEKSSEKVVDRLPDLDDEDKATALSSTHWAGGMVEALPVGTIHQMEGVGVDLQVISKEVVRCLAVVDHPYCYLCLAMMTISFDSAGIDLEVDPYTVVRPFVPKEEAEGPLEEEVEAIGIEVA
jgi:hypothetical protein